MGRFFALTDSGYDKYLINKLNRLFYKLKVSHLEIQVRHEFTFNNPIHLYEWLASNLNKSS